MIEPGKMMLFIDGENLVFRYQAMQKEGYVSKPNILHVKDTLVWSPTIYMPHEPQIVRPYYYTSVVGDTDKVSSIITQLKGFAINVVMNSRQGNL